MAIVPVCAHPKARQQGAVTLKVDTVHYTSAQMNQMLLERIYAGQIADDLIRPAWVGALGVFVLGLMLAIRTGPAATPQPRGRDKAKRPRDGHG